MADGVDLQELVRRTVQANARLYKGWLDLSLEYFRGIAEIFSGEPEPASTNDTLDDGAGALVFEGEGDTTASAAFLVTNDLGRSIRCQLVATGFSDADGNTVSARTSFDPATFDLEPGSQGVVRVSVPIDRKLVPGVAYAGEFSVKGMEGFSVAAVIRRRHSIEASPIDRVAATGAKAQATDAASEKGKTATRKHAAKKGSTGKRTTQKSPTRGAGKGAAKQTTKKKTTKKKTTTKKAKPKKTTPTN